MTTEAICRNRIGRSTAICISHKEDVDGIASSAIIKAVYNPNVVVILVDYINMIDNLRYVERTLSEETEKIKKRELYICDIAIIKKDWSNFVEIVSRIISSLGHGVTYIDHHPLEQEMKVELISIGVRLIHSTEECTSVLAYEEFKTRLSPSAAFLAAYAAIADYMEDRPLAASVISKFDKLFLMLECALLSYAIAASQSDEQYLYTTVDKLSNMKHPHEIEGVFSLTEGYVNRISSMVSAIQGAILEKSNISYAYTSGGGLTARTIVNFVLGSSKKPVAIVYNLIDETNLALLVIKGSKSCKVHLGKIVNNIALTVNGSGGGHEKDCGAIIPYNKVEDFICLLDKSIC